MPKKVKELSAAEVKRLVEPGFYAVGGVPGLNLDVSSADARSWILRVMITSKRRYIGLGGYPDVSLAKARESARAIREQIREGVDPVAEKRAALDALKAQQLKVLTFAEAAERCHSAKSADFKSAKHRKDWISSLERHAHPVVGSIPVQQIELAHVMQVLEPIWATRTETATRVRQRMESVLRWATVSGFREGDNPARWEDNLQELLPSPKKITKVQHQKALHWKEVPGFMGDLRQREGMGARALEFAILTAARSGEVRLARWAEFDMQGKMWTVPAERMKAGREHRVPLSDAAVKILQELPRFEGSDYVFPAIRGGALSDATLSAVTRRMGVEAVPHGFRSSFKDWCRSSTAYLDEVSELALAHVSTDATRAAYARDGLLDKRRALMKEWARYCEHGYPDEKAVTVSHIGEARA